MPSRQHVDEASEAAIAAFQGLEQAPWPETFIESCITPRKARRFPQKLYNALERDLLLRRADELRQPTAKEDEQMASEFPEDAPAIYRELEKQDRRQQQQVKCDPDPTLRDVRRLLASIWARYALESVDFKDKGARQKSAWYKEHGKGAGKDVVAKTIQIGEIKQNRELLPTSDAGETGMHSARDLPPHMTSSRASRQGQDSSLMRFGPRRSASPVSARRGGVDRSEGSNHGKRGRNHSDRDSNTEQLDAEIDAYLAGRAPDDAAAQEFRTRYVAGWDDDEDTVMGSGADSAGPDSAKPRVRGRGRHKAPSSSALAGWGDDDDSGSVGAYASRASVTGGMYVDDMTEEFGRFTGHRGRAQRGGGGGARAGNGAGWSNRNYETASGGVNGGSSLVQRLGQAPGQPTLSERLGRDPRAAASAPLNERLT